MVEIGRDCLWGNLWAVLRELGAGSGVFCDLMMEGWM
jgi:hypothetical protein